MDLVYEILETAGYKAMKFSSGEDFLQQESISDVGCLSLDNQMPGMTGREVQHQLVERGCQIPIIFMSGESRYEDVAEAVKEGALYFLQKPFTSTELLEKVKHGVDASLAQLSARKEEEKANALLDKLTKRERQVYDLVTVGLTNKAIARELVISNGTVEFHRANMMKKLNALTLADLMAIVKK